MQFKNHIFRKHNFVHEIAHNKSSFSSNFSCNVQGCLYENEDFKNTCKHFYRHVKEGVHVKCPFKCKSTTIFKNLNTIKQHICRTHYFNLSSQTNVCEVEDKSVNGDFSDSVKIEQNNTMINFNTDGENTEKDNLQELGLKLLSSLSQSSIFIYL